MADVVFVVVALGFFGLCVAYVRGLDRLVRSAEEPDDAEELDEPTELMGEATR